MRYQLPGVDNRTRETWEYTRAYEMPPEPNVSTPTDDDTMVPVEEVPPSATVDNTVDVRVVNFAREPDRFRDARIYKLAVPAGVRVSIARRRERTQLTLRVDSANATDVVYIGHEKGTTDKTGYPLYGGTTYPHVIMHAQRGWELYNPGVDDLTVAIIDEFITELK